MCNTSFLVALAYLYPTVQAAVRPSVNMRECVEVLSRILSTIPPLMTIDLWNDRVP